MPDMYILGKALGGGIVPVSAVVAHRDVLGVFAPGEHGSTFGGNPLACAVGLEVVALLRTGEYQRAPTELGDALHRRGSARRVGHERRRDPRPRLWAGIDSTPGGGTGRAVCEGCWTAASWPRTPTSTTLRLAPPLCVIAEDLDWATDRILAALAERVS